MGYGGMPGCRNACWPAIDRKIRRAPLLCGEHHCFAGSAHLRPCSAQDLDKTAITCDSFMFILYLVADAMHSLRLALMGGHG